MAAEEEIEISELEFRSELNGDDLLAVETSANTFATSLTSVKNWLSQFFVGLTGNQSINGIKEFLENPIVPDLDVSDNSQKAANTSFVKSKVDAAISQMLASLYPVGAVYIGTQSTCPMTSLITGSTWALVASDKALWTGNGSNGNTTKAAGLPNFTQDIGYTGTNGNGGPDGRGDTYNSGWIYPRCNNSPNHVYVKPSTVNSIYGNSNTVQPPAYVVNVWRRTA